MTIRWRLALGKQFTFYLCIYKFSFQKKKKKYRDSQRKNLNKLS